MKKVFVANDDFGYLYQLNTLFTRKGFYVRTFSHSQSLFDALEESLPDLVMLDVNLSGENGKEIREEIKTRYNNMVSVVLSSEEELKIRRTKDEVSYILNTCLLQ